MSLLKMSATRPMPRCEISDLPLDETMPADSCPRCCKRVQPEVGEIGGLRMADTRRRRRTPRGRRRGWTPRTRLPQKAPQAPARVSRPTSSICGKPPRDRLFVNCLNSWTSSSIASAILNRGALVTRPITANSIPLEQSRAASRPHRPRPTTLRSKRLRQKTLPPHPLCGIPSIFAPRTPSGLKQHSASATASPPSATSCADLINPRSAAATSPSMSARSRSRSSGGERSAADRKQGRIFARRQRRAAPSAAGRSRRPAA